MYFYNNVSVGAFVQNIGACHRYVPCENSISEASSGSAGFRPLGAEAPLATALLLMVKRHANNITVYYYHKCRESGRCSLPNVRPFHVKRTKKHSKLV